jgi:hypothetical protein
MQELSAQMFRLGGQIGSILANVAGEVCSAWCNSPVEKHHRLIVCQFSPGGIDSATHEYSALLPRWGSSSK